MPFTLAHPAAVLPLRRGILRDCHLSALVIGSVVPDVVYFFSLPVSRAESHSLAGVFWFCLPVGILLFIAHQLLFKRPALALLPYGLHARCATDGSWERGRLPLVVALMVAIVLGTVTHVAWDSFTHQGGWFVKRSPMLQLVLFHVAGYELQVYRLLQHLSSLVGCALLAFWTLRWYRVTEPVEVAPSERLSRPLRLGVLGTLVVTTVAVGLYNFLAGESDEAWLASLRHRTGALVFSSLPTLSIGFFLYVLLWPLRPRR